MIGFARIYITRRTVRPRLDGNRLRGQVDDPRSFQRFKQVRQSPVAEGRGRKERGLWPGRKAKRRERERGKERPTGGERINYTYSDRAASSEMIFPRGREKKEDEGSLNRWSAKTRFSSSERYNDFLFGTWSSWRYRVIVRVIAIQICHIRCKRCERERCIKRKWIYHSGLSLYTRVRLTIEFIFLLPS